MLTDSKSGGWLSPSAAVLLLSLFVASCSSITPYQPRNHREEGSEKGIFTGSKGEFVIAIPTPGEIPKEDEKAKKTSEETLKIE